MHGHGRSCALKPHGRILIQNQHGASYDSLRVRASHTTAPAIHCRNSSRVQLRRLMVEHHAKGVGILFDRCDNITINQVVVVAVQKEALPDDGLAHAGPCVLGAGARSHMRECDNIHGINSRGASIVNTRVVGGAAGIELHRCPGARLRGIAARNMLGPYPRGQCVQFSECDGASLTNFHCRNELNRSWPEDSVSVWRSKGVSIRDGLVDGSNAPNGVGVMFENDRLGASGGLIEDVDAIHMGGGCFSGYPARRLRMVRARCGWNHCTGQGGRARPSSGGQMWAAGRAQNGIASAGIVVDDSQFWAACDSSRPPAWHAAGLDGAYARVDIRQARFTPRSPAAGTMRMCWERSDAG